MCVSFFSSQCGWINYVICSSIQNLPSKSLLFFFKVALSIPQPVSFFVVTKADGKSHSLPFKGPEEDGEGKWEVTANPVKELKAFSPLKRTNSNTEGCSLRNTCFYFVPDCLWQDVGKHLVLYSEGLQRGDIRKRTDCI